MGDDTDDSQTCIGNGRRHKDLHGIKHLSPLTRFIEALEGVHNVTGCNGAFESSAVSPDTHLSLKDELTSVQDGSNHFWLKRCAVVETMPRLSEKSEREEHNMERKRESQK